MNFKSNLSYLLTIVLFLYCVGSVFCQENKINFIFSDSIHIHHPNNSIFQGFTSLEDGKIKFISSDINAIPEVFYYDLKGEFIERVSLDIFYKENIRISMSSFDKMESGFLLYDQLSKKYYYLDKSFQIISSKKLRPKFNKNNYSIVAGSPLVNYKYDKRKGFATLPIKPFKWKGFSNNKKYNKGGKEYYNTPGLVGLFNIEGKCIQTLGKFDKIYQGESFLPDLHYVSFYYNHKSGILFIGQKASPRIQVYDLYNNHKVGDLGEQGKFIKVSPDSLTRIKNFKEGHDYTIRDKLFIESPEYNSIYHHDSLDLVFRFYRTMVKDTTTVDSAYIELMEQFKKEKIMSCPAPSRQILNQRNLMKSKPDYLQIYSGFKNFNLLHDKAISIPIKAPRILGHDNEYIYIRSFFKANSNTITIYKYKIEVI